MITIDRSISSYGCRFSEEPNKYRRAYYSEHKDKFVRDYKANYQKHKEYYREYYRKHKAKINAYCREYNARKRIEG